jgi:hypothetical protein
VACEWTSREKRVVNKGYRVFLSATLHVDQSTIQGSAYTDRDCVKGPVVKREPSTKVIASSSVAHSLFDLSCYEEAQKRAGVACKNAS